MSIPQTIQHFTHNHLLTQVNGIGTYTCDGCKLYGEGRTYRCSDCDYDLHEYCATCPSILLNSCHGPDHELSLFNGHMTERSCYVCRVSIQGMFYKCRQCSFEAHPLCTYAPMHASSPDIFVTKQRSLHGHAGQPSPPHQYGQGIPYGYPHMGQPEPYPPQGGGYQPQNQNYYPYMNSGSPKTESMGHPETYPPQGGGHQHQHQHQNHQPGPYTPQGDGHQHQQQNHHPYMNSGSPKSESSAVSTTTKTKKKKPGFFGAMKAAATATVTIAAQVAVAAMTDGETTYE
ncbi:hypothetical protein AtNW77_Chr2g0259141 [Arabidopsis thaliana]|uniref:DC1 domain-containing protein n=2 Tax=Arabidopsis TaxID=3701 RepID=A0A178VSL0_ARATH|nr:DC1 [Arabidopsis thaliana x Arabidopsis arenosa]OAP08826.1 hypothetical protein AXX17_AT2G34610 [Arabidopsis thaliana]